MSEIQGKVSDLIFGRWRSQILYAGVKLGIFEALCQGPQNVAGNCTGVGARLRSGLSAPEGPWVS